MLAARGKIYVSCDVEIDTARVVIRRAGVESSLRPKTFRLLVYLAEHRDRLVPKEELIAQLWPGVAVTDGALAQCIADIRRVLDEDPRNPKFIRTAARLGYRFIAPLDEKHLDSIAVEQITEERLGHSENVSGKSELRPVDFDTTPVQTSVEEAGRPRFRILAVACLALAATTASWAVWARHASPPPVPGKRVIAILPFENRSGQSDLGWLREGLPDMLATTFARSKALDVLSREQVHSELEGRRNPGIKSDLESARAVHAQAVVRGSFSKLGSGMRVDVQILDVQSGSAIASGDVSVDREERFLTQIDSLAARLAGRLAPPDPVQGRLSLESVMTANLEAYHYYSVGLEKAEALQTPEAIALFEKALALDPGFAMAYARIGYAYSVTAVNFERGRPYLEKAFRMSGKLSDKDRRYIRAWYAIANRDYQAAIRLYTELVSEYPNDSESHFRLAELLRGESRHDEALESLQRAKAIDPEDPKIYNELSHVLSEMGRHDDAIARAGRYRALAPDDPNAYDSLGLCYHMAGQYERALEAYGKALALKPDFAIAARHRALLYAAVGRVKDGVRDSLRADNYSTEHLTGLGCRGREQAAFILWRSGKTAEVQKLTPQSRLGCDGPVWQIALGAARPNSDAISTWGAGRGARYGQRTDYFFRAELAKQQGRTEDRLANLRQLVGVKPGWSELDIFEDALADAYLELGRVDDAIGEYERALRVFPGIARARYHLAKAYDSKGQNELSRQEFRQFLALWKHADPELPELAEAKRALD